MSKCTIRFIGLLSIMVFGLMTAGAVSAEEKFPSKPIELIVPWNPGGAADLAARIVATIAPKYFSVPFTVHNKPGGGGVLATRYAAKARPDGYTLLAGYGGGEHLSTPHIRKVPFDTLKDFAPICMIANVPIVVTVRADSPFKTAKDLVEYAKKHPGKIKYGASGIGSSTDLTMIMLGYKAGVKFTAVPFKGGSASLAALLDAGKVRALGLSAPRRSINYKDIPTFIEQGYEVEVISPKGLAAPAGTPPERIKKLGELFAKVMKDKKIAKLLAAVGLEPGYQPADEFKATIARYYKEYGEALETMGLKIK